MAFFVGGQLLLAFVVVPALRAGVKGPLDAVRRPIMRRAARRFGYGSLIALAVLALTGAGMASDLGRWGDRTLHVKLALVGVAVVVIVLHARKAHLHALAAVVLVLSLVIVWLGVGPAH